MNNVSSNETFAPARHHGDEVRASGCGAGDASAARAAEETQGQGAAPETRVQRARRRRLRGSNWPATKGKRSIPKLPLV